MQSLLFLTGRVRSKEAQLLTAAAWQRFAEARGFPAWMELLRDTPYMDCADKAASFEQFETALNEHFRSLKQDLFSTAHYALEPLLWRKYDMHNVKVLLKIRFGHKNLHTYLVRLGELSLELLEAFIVRNENVALPLRWQKIIHHAEEVYKAHDRSFAMMDRYLDGVLFADLLDAAGPFGAEVKGFIQAQIDAANLKLWWFARGHKDTVTEYIPGGHIPPREFMTALDDAPEQMLQKVFPKSATVQTTDEALVQRALDDATSQYLYQQRFAGRGIMPVLVYARAKEMEMKNLKTYYLRQQKNYTKLSDYLRETYA